MEHWAKLGEYAFEVVYGLRRQLTHETPKLPSYRNQSTDLLCKSDSLYLLPDMEVKQLRLVHNLTF